jgi:hypothetical protein
MTRAAGLIEGLGWCRNIHERAADGLRQRRSCAQGRRRRRGGGVVVIALAYPHRQGVHGYVVHHSCAGV